MDGINITSAQHVYDAVLNQNVCIKATIEGVEVFVPLTAGNTYYDEIMRQVEDGELTIQEAS